MQDDDWDEITTLQLESLDLDEINEALNESFDSLDSFSTYKIYRQLKKIWREYDRLPMEVKFDLRLKIQALYSALLEADKALLAIKDSERYFQNNITNFPSKIIDEYIAQQRQGQINALREEARQIVLKRTEELFDNRLFALTLPTGLGKTLTALTWALKLKEQQARSKIIVVLPFLSIIEQTEKVYRRLFNIQKQGSEILSFHSLSMREYSDSEANEQDFFIDTWRSSLIITTYDQLLLALFSDKAKHQMRMHQLCDALIILDELQSLPTILWEPVKWVFRSLTHHCHSRILVMSATLPSFLEGATPLLSSEQQKKFYSHFNRYRIELRYRKSMSLEDFVDFFMQEHQKQPEKRLLITLNTRASAKHLYFLLAKEWEGHIFLLSSDLTPKDRHIIIEKVQKLEEVLLISTQSIEAGVDIDMDWVIRDFAPLDSLIQVAGRCNRHDKSSQKRVTIVQLHDEKRKFFSDMIYDAVHLSATSELLQQHEIIHENEILEMSERYFEILMQRKDLGKKEAKDFADWKEHLNIRRLLREEQGKKVQLIVAHQREGIREKIAAILSIKDRWERRRELRKLAPEIASITVSVYLRDEAFLPRIAEGFPQEAPFFWFLKEEYYDERTGIQLPDFFE